MSDWLDGSEVGDIAFVDDEGLVRFRGRTCNLYGTPGDAETAARSSARLLGRVAYIWRTVDGLYDYSVKDDAPVRIPELAGAELVRVTVVDGETT